MMSGTECHAKATDLECRADEAAGYDEVLAWETLAAEWRDLAKFARRQEALEQKYGRPGR